MSGPFSPSGLGRFRGIGPGRTKCRNWPPGGVNDGGPLRVTDAHLSAALDQLLDTRNQLTRVLLGAQQEPGQ